MRAQDKSHEPNILRWGLGLARQSALQRGINYSGKLKVKERSKFNKQLQDSTRFLLKSMMLLNSTCLLYRDYKSNSEWNRFRMVKLCSMTSKLLQSPIRMHRIRAMSRLPMLGDSPSWAECLNNEGSTTQRLKIKGYA